METNGNDHLTDLTTDFGPLPLLLFGDFGRPIEELRALLVRKFERLVAHRAHRVQVLARYAIEILHTLRDGDVPKCTPYLRRQFVTLETRGDRDLMALEKFLLVFVPLNDDGSFPIRFIAETLSGENGGSHMRSHEEYFASAFGFLALCHERELTNTDRDAVIAAGRTMLKHFITYEQEMWTRVTVCVLAGLEALKCAEAMDAVVMELLCRAPSGYEFDRVTGQAQRQLSDGTIAACHTVRRAITSDILPVKTAAPALVYIWDLSCRMDRNGDASLPHLFKRLFGEAWRTHLSGYRDIHIR